MSIIGILGGNGAVATSRFHQLVVTFSLDKGFYQDEDFVNMIIVNSANDLITSQGNITDEQKLLRHFSYLSPIFSNADYLMVLCNTFHKYEKEIINIFSPELISIPALVREQLYGKSVRRPLILSSQTSINEKLYASTYYEEDYLAVPELIEAGMKGFTSHQKITDVVAIVQNNNYDAVVLGCTDLSIFGEVLKELCSVNIFDSLEIAAEAVVQIQEKEKVS